MHGACRVTRWAELPSETHPVAHGIHRFAREPTASISSRRKGIIDHFWFRRKLSSTAPDRDQLLLHRFGEDLLAIDATPAGRRALGGDVLDRCDWAERLVEVIDVTDLRRPRIGPLDPLGVRHRGPELIPDLLARLE